MSEKPKVGFKPLTHSDKPNIPVKVVPKFTPTPFIGKITQQIGTGEDAKHSIVWITIRWSFVISTSLTLILFIFLGFAYYNNNQAEIAELKKYILSIWSVFTPLITLSLGYAFGKDIKQ